MADRIRVSYGALDTAAGDLTAAANQMAQRMQQLQSDIAPMLSTWDGAAREAYASAQRQWDAGWTELQGALQQMQAATVRANDGYQAGETRNVGLFPG